mgnify:CR=1 FL=1
MQGSDLFGRCPPAKTAFSGGFFAGGDEARSQPGKTKVLAVRTREASFAPQAQAPFISTMQRGMKQEIEQARCQSRLYTLAKRVLRLRRKALCARTACTFGATNPSLLLTHNKNSTDKSLCCFCGAP